MRVCVCVCSFGTIALEYFVQVVRVPSKGNVGILKENSDTPLLSSTTCTRYILVPGILELSMSRLPYSSTILPLYMTNIQSTSTPKVVSCAQLAFRCGTLAALCTVLEYYNCSASTLVQLPVVHSDSAIQRNHICTTICIVDRLRQIEL